MRRLAPQVDASNGRVAIYVLEDQGAEKIGEKRQRMIDAVAETGEPFCCFIDDDDLVSHDYISSILEAIDQGADVVGFRHLYYEDGKLRGNSVTTVKAKNWRTEMQKDGLALHFRTPNHLNPVRTEMALSIGYKPMQAGEDADYSDRLFKTFPNMREIFIDKVLYIYEYRTPSKRAESENLPVEDVL